MSSYGTWHIVMRRVALTLATLGGLAACSPAHQPKQSIGTLAGAATGAYVGQMFGGGVGRLATTAGGTFLGALIGGEIGRSLDRADQLHLQQTRQRALESTPAGSSVRWVNPDSGHSGTVTPLRTYQTSHGRYCRDYRMRVRIGGVTEEAYGTACREDDGRWRIQS